jgi:16S rRNA C967 or C1407 C5-methylase (RsmB/RsmF family)
MQLPEDFIRETRLLMGEDRFNRFLGAFDEEAPVSIRLNPRAQGDCPRCALAEGEVPWCPEGYYLSGRPQFTFDPLFHAGCYYVQEAASMFITHVLRTLFTLHSSLFTLHSSLFTVLDLCAAPGGKSTAMRTVLPEGSVLVSNEPIPTRAQILLENITKWGWPDCIVTNNYPRDFRKAKMKFDLILCDVPCSGEGMFRKDPATISEWSLQNLDKCWRLQREIVADAWECLNPGGILIYSTCTYNIKENEENVRWILETYDAEALTIPTEPSWNITGSLLPGFDAPVYRFIPGITRSEGLFLCVLRKTGGNSVTSSPPKLGGARGGLNNGSILRTFRPPLTPPDSGGESLRVDLSYQDALKYLRGEALVLPPDTPRGIVTVTYKGFPLGPAKNIGPRANNLYPKPWRIKTTHLPSEPVEIL